jgi:hypothetical protein
LGVVKYTEKTHNEEESNLQERRVRIGTAVGKRKGRAARKEVEEETLSCTE